MTYVQLYKRDLSGKVVECVGSDQIVRLDGRWSLDTMHKECRHLCWVRKMQKSPVVGYRIFKTLSGLLSAADQHALSDYVSVEKLDEPSQ